MVMIFLLMVFVISQGYLRQALSGRDIELTESQKQIDDLTSILATDQAALQQVRSDLSAQTLELQETRTQLEVTRGLLHQTEHDLSKLAINRDQLNKKLALLLTQLQENLTERDRLVERLRLKTKTTEALNIRLEAALAAGSISQQHLVETQNQREELIAEQKKLTADLLQARADSQARLDRLNTVLTELGKAFGVQHRTQKQLEAALSKQELLSTELEQVVQEKDQIAGELQQITNKNDPVLLENMQIKSEKNDEMLKIRRNLHAMQNEVGRLIGLLTIREREIAARNVKITALGQRLNGALASKVEELARYRSEFFGRLRAVLGDRQDIRVTGDRFVFQSEVLFATSSVEIEIAGQAQLAQFAKMMQALASEIPSEIDWVLRVDGHTDQRPILSPVFPSNWELSTARAVSVVKFLIAQGIPAKRLVAAGFGAFSPLDRAETERAYQRNRRIELKLTNR